ncbi:MAG: hypothetical protein OXF41_18920, partial [bacterium]|nr:hypothetical protein [bacterium]
MSSIHEAAFEAHIAGFLVERGGYRRVKTTGEGYESDFDGNTGVDTADLFEFIGATQGDRWDKLVDAGYGGDPVILRPVTKRVGVGHTWWFGGSRSAPVVLCHFNRTDLGFVDIEREGDEVPRHLPHLLKGPGL